MDTPIIRYCAVSSIEQSHRAPVTDILWIPDHFEVSVASHLKDEFSALFRYSVAQYLDKMFFIL